MFPAAVLCLALLAAFAQVHQAGGQVLAVGALALLGAQVLGFEPYRAAKRDLSSEALEVARHLPAGETVWVLGPADLAGKHSSLFHYLDRPVRAFRPRRELPEDGAHCLLTAGNLERLAAEPAFAFRETARVDHPWFSYRLGVCSVASAAATPSAGG